MIKREANFGSTLAAWIRSKPLERSGPIETKQTTIGYISFSCVPDHQLYALLACKTSEKGFLYKISDESQGHKPFDFVYYYKSAAWIVIKFPGRFFVIDVEAFIKEKEMSTRQSLTIERAFQICTIVINR